MRRVLGHARRLRLAALVAMALPSAAPAQELTTVAAIEATRAASTNWQAAVSTVPATAFFADRVGRWRITIRHWMDPSAPPDVSTGVAVNRLIMDGMVLQESLSITSRHGHFEGFGLSGYDDLTGRYWHTWIDNASTGVSVLYGRWDEGRETLVFDGTTPDPIEGEARPMRIESWVDGPERQINAFYFPGLDGDLVKTIEIVYEKS